MVAEGMKLTSVLKTIDTGKKFKDLGITSFKSIETYTVFLEEMYNQQITTLTELDVKHYNKESHYKELCETCIILKNYTDAFKKNFDNATEAKRSIFNARQNGQPIATEDSSTEAGTSTDLATREAVTEHNEHPTMGARKLENPLFFGEDRKLRIEEWFRQMEIRMNLAGTSYKMKIPLLSTYLKGPTGRIAKNFMEEGNTNYELFKGRMIQKFSDKYAKVKDLDQFHLLKQANFNCFSDYIIKFTELADRLQLGNEMMLDRLLAQLKPEYARHVKANPNIKCFDDAESYCLQLESIDRQQSVNILAKKQSCTYCGKTNHTIDKCFKRQNQSKPTTNANKYPDKKVSGFNVKCFKCNKIGHKANACKVKKIFNLNENKNLEEDTFKMSKVFNFATDQSDIPWTMCRLNNSDESFVVGIDTAADFSLVSEGCAKRLSLVGVETPLKYMLADGTEREKCMCFSNITIDISGYTCKVDLFDIGNSQFDVLLGINALKKLKAGIYPYLDLLRFPSGDVKLNVRNQCMSLSIKKDGEVKELTEAAKVETPYDDEDILENIEWSVPQVEIKTEIKMKKEQEQNFLCILNENKDRFAHSAHDLEKSDFLIFNASIERPEEPVYTRPYRYSMSEEDEIERQVRDWLSCGQIVHSKSRWSSPCLLVDKQDKTKRVVIDYRRVNQRTRKEPFSLAHIDTLLARIATGIYFSVLDFKAGFQQVLMDPKIAQYFAFSTSKSHYEPRVMQFVMKNAPLHFSKLMHLLLGDLTFVVIFIDDLVIFTSSFEEHMRALKIIFYRIRKAKLKLNGKKCKWLCKRIEYLGYIIEDNFIRMSKDKVDKIVNRIAPKSVKDVQTYMGLINYYRKFIKDFAGITSCITDLLKKGTVFSWSDECNASFNNLKRILTSTPILRLPDYNKPYIMDVDSSNVAVGAVLSQLDDEGKEYAVYFASRTLKKAELNYTISEKECLAVVFGLLKFRTYIFGREFKVRTDHIALKWLMTIDTPISRLCRWSIFIQSFGDFVIEYRPGKQHGNADCLSREVAAPKELSVMSFQTMESNSKDKYKNKALMYYVKNKDHLNDLPRSKYNNIENEALHYVVDQYGIWYKSDSNGIKYLLVPEIKLRKDIIERNHLLGHYLTQTTYDRIIVKYYWHDIKKDIKLFINNCGACQRNELSKVFNHPAKAITAKRVFSSIRLDYIHGLPTSDRGNSCILNIVDAVSSWFELYALPNKEAVNSVDCLRDWCCRYGTPDEILSDRGNEFTANLVKEFCERVGIEKLVTAAYNPRTNGKVERLNGTIVRSLRKHCENNTHDWEKWLSYIMMAYRSRINSTTKFSPYELVFGSVMNTFDPIPLNDNNTEDICNRAIELKTLVETTRPTAQQNIEKSQIRQKITQDKRVNVRKEALEINTKVMILNDGIIPKLTNRYKGYYTIENKDELDNYTLKDNLGNIVNQKYPLHKLKVVSNEEETLDKETAEVEKILDDKCRDNENYYLVKWKNRSSSENEWVHDSDFFTKAVINKYLNDKKNMKKRGRGRPPGKISVISLIGIVFMLFLANLGTCSSEYVHEKGNFKYCSGAYQRTPIDRKNVCHYIGEPEYKSQLQVDFNTFIEERFEPKDNEEKQEIKLDVYTKENQSVIGVGYQCSVVEYNWSFGLTIFGYRWKTVTEKVKHLEPRECAVMSKSEDCYGNKMTCAEKICKFKGNVKEEYSVWGNINKKTTNCQIKERTITALNSQAHLFGTKCVVTDNYCRLPESIIVWKENVIKTCPFRRLIKNVPFKIDNITIYSTDHNLAFRFRSIVNYCDTKMIRTYEGAFLMKGNNEDFYKQTDLPAEDNNIRSLRLTELSLASLDYTAVESRQNMKYLFRTQCRIFEALLYSASYTNDRYFVLKDYKGNEVTLYSLNNQLFKPVCSKVTDIYFEKSTNECFQDIKILARVGDKNISAFLTNHRIIKKHSKKFKCLKNFLRATETSDNSYIINKNNIQNLVNKRDFKLEKITFINSQVDDVIFHDDILRESLLHMLHENEDSTIHDFIFPYVENLVENDNFVFENLKKSIFLYIFVVIVCFSCCLFVSCKFIMSCPTIFSKSIRWLRKTKNTEVKVKKEIGRFETDNNDNNRFNNECSHECSHECRSENELESITLRLVEKAIKDEHQIQENNEDIIRIEENRLPIRTEVESDVEEYVPFPLRL